MCSHFAENTNITDGLRALGKYGII